MAILDAFKGANNVPTYAPRKAFSITPNDNTDLIAVTKKLLVGTAGTVKLIMADDVDNGVVTVTLPAGLLDLQVRRVLTGGSAGGLFGFYG